MVNMGSSENVVSTPLYPMVLLIRQSRFEKWLAIIGKINPTFSDKPIWHHGFTLSFLSYLSEVG